MTENITFTMIKPDAVQSNFTGKIIDKILEAGFRIKAMKYLHLSEIQAAEFYEIHRERPFFNDLIKYMSGGPIVAAVLEKENAVESYRNLIGATDPKKAEPGTIRNLFAKSIEANAVHGSDSNENAMIESAFFFSKLEWF